MYNLLILFALFVALLETAINVDGTLARASDAGTEGADTDSVTWEASRHATEESARGEEFHEADGVVSGRMYQAETGWQWKWQSG